MADTTPTMEPKEPITETEIVQPQSRRRGILVAVVVVIVLVLPESGGARPLAKTLTMPR